MVQMYGRKIAPRHLLREDTPEHLYLPGPHRGVWNEQALIASKEIILCEALIDALTFWCAGYRNVTTSYGVNGLYRRDQGGVPEARHEENLHRLRPRRRGRECGPQTRGRTHARWASSVSECSFPRPGRQRVRAEEPARREVAGHVLDQRRVAGQRQAAHSGGDRAAVIEARPRSRSQRRPALRSQHRGGRDQIRSERRNLRIDRRAHR